MTEEELKQIIEAIAEAYEKAGKKLVHAMEIEEIKEDGTIEGKVLLDETDKN